MKIESIKAKYDIQMAPKLKICFEINQDEETCEQRCLSFDPKSGDYGIIGVLSIYDETEDGLVQSWEEKIDLRSKLYYGFLDELIENAIFDRMKSISANSDEMIGNYRVDDPAVVWMGCKETFKKVVSGWAIHDRKDFFAEIIGEKGNRERVNIYLPENADAVRNFEGRTFMEVLDDIEARI